MDVIMLIGRILMGGYFFMSGMNHFMKREMMTGYAESKRLPMPKLSVLGTGVLLVLGGLGLLLGMYVHLALILLIIFLIPVSFMVHAFWKATDENMKMIDMQHFLKNMALLGAVLMLYALYAGDWMYAFNTGF